MTTTNTEPTSRHLSDADLGLDAIRDLRAEAATAGDTEQVAICDRALVGDQDALTECYRVIDAAAAMAEPANGPELSDGIASYRRTWSRFDGLVCSAACGSDPSVRQVGVFAAGDCQPTITDADGRRYVVQDLGSLRVEEPPECPCEGDPDTLPAAGREADAWWAWHDADPSRWSPGEDPLEATADAERRCTAWLRGESTDGPES